MIKNYLTVAVRNIARNKTFSAINILGLAIGMACCILILLYVQDELSYDQHHEHAHRIYRLAEETHIAGQTRRIAITSFPMGPALVQDYPTVVDAVRFFRNDERTLVANQQNHFYERGVLFTDANVFRVFDFPLSKGDPQTALQEPYSIVLTEKMARKYFGDQDPMGQMLSVGEAECKITGVLKDTDQNTHLQFNFLASPIKRKDWIDHDYYTYLLLQDNHAADELETKLPDFIERYIGKQLKAAGGQIRPFLQPLTDIYLHSHLEFEISPNGDIRYVYLFLIIAFFVLVLACINFMNLSTARSASRSKEVGMRKVVGANRAQLIRQFIGESILLALLALLFAVVLVEVSLPAFNAFIQRELVLDYTGSWDVLFALLGVALFAGMLSGIYPAFFLSAFQPVEVLKSTLKRGLKTSSSRKTLVVFQFVISIILIIGTVVVYHQSDYIKNKKLGFNKEQVIVIPIDRQLAKRYKPTVSAHVAVLNVSASSTVPGREIAAHLFRPSLDVAHKDASLLNVMHVDQEFIQTFGIEVLEGRAFSEDVGSDRNGAFILNEAAMRHFGWTSCANQKFENVYPEGGGLKVEVQGDVVGVVKDFHYKSLHHEIEPLVIMMGGGWTDYLSLRIHSDDIAGTLKFLKTQWHEVVPNTPFDYSFLDDDYDKLYRIEEQIGTLFGLFSILAIFVASLGLFGLASFTAQQRIKEIGIRKVLGASVSNLVLMLSKEFALLVGLANLIAWPIAYYAMHRWLQDFAYRIDLEIWAFVLSGFLALFIALSTVSYQAWKVARTNPVDALRYE